MRKPQQTFDLEIPDDYKLASVLERDRADFESTNIWFYVGADYRDRRFAKVGITMGDLRSRSYSSSNPDYYLFCGFQCKHDTTRADLKNIERDVLSYLDEYYPNRAPHRESRRLSECFYDINFEDFLSMFINTCMTSTISTFRLWVSKMERVMRCHGCSIAAYHLQW